MKIKIIKEFKYKFISASYKADWDSVRLYPRFWINNASGVPNFDHWSFVIRFGWWYFGIQKNWN